MPLPTPENKALTGAYEETLSAVREAMRIPVSEDAICREFTLMGQPAALFYVDGLSSADQIQHHVLAPCLAAAGENPTAEHLTRCVLPAAEVRVEVTAAYRQERME